MKDKKNDTEEEKNNYSTDNIDDTNNTTSLTETEAKTFCETLKKYLKHYQEKDPKMPDKEWLEWMFKQELPDTDLEVVKSDAEEIVKSIKTFDDNLVSVNNAAKNGISKESWLVDKIQEASVGMSVQEYGKCLQGFDDILRVKNAELAEALSVAKDGNISRINMNPNLDGFLAENLVAKTTELSGFVQGKNIRVDILQSNASNSVDVRAINLDTGKFQNYQLKFGKDAAHTIKYIEEGNYNNQRIIVASDQLEEVQAHFKAKGSNKTITDHIDAWGVEGKKFTKEELKEIQRVAQEDGIMPSMDYSHYQTKDLALSIGKNAGVMALQGAMVSTGVTVATKIFKGEKVDANELVQIALKTGTDTSIKVVTAGTLQVLVRKGIISIIPQATPAGVIANIACVGIENVKVLAKIMKGELSVTQGLDQMQRTTVSMVGGLWAMAQGAKIGATMGAAAFGWIPVAGVPLVVASSMVGGMVGYFAGSKVGELLYETHKKVHKAAGTVVKAAWNGVKSTARAVVKGAKSIAKKVFGLFS